MSTFVFDRTCENCGARVQQREGLSALDAFVLHVVEVVFCPKCGTELPKDSGGEG